MAVNRTQYMSLSCVNCRPYYETGRVANIAQDLRRHQYLLYRLIESNKQKYFSHNIYRNCILGMTFVSLEINRITE